MDKSVADAIEQNIAERVKDSLILNGNIGAWQRCYQLFGDRSLDRDYMAVHLGHFLATWGMMRASFLKSYDYHIHLGAIDRLREEQAFGLRAGLTDGNLERVLQIRSKLKEYYNVLPRIHKDPNVTDTLATKIMLVSLGCVPAYDRYLVGGLRSHGISGRFGKRSLIGLLKFVDEYNSILAQEQARYSEQLGFRVPMMRLVDMHFWTEGKKLSDEAA